MHILIVEDELGIVQFLQQGLQEEGYRITTANDGLKGFELTQRHHFDLIILDWMLPKISGLDLCKAIRIENQATPIIFLTAKDTAQETIQGFKAGANDYIKKPFSFEELVERVRVHFRFHRATETLLLGNIRVDLAKYSVIKNNKEVSVTQREFELLTYLIQNKGKVCTRNQILRDVWGINFEYDTGVIDVFINAIRKKLNLKIEEDYIKTIRGVGYIAND